MRVTVWYKPVLLLLAASVSVFTGCEGGGSDTNAPALVVPAPPAAGTFHVEGTEQLPYFPSMDAVMDPAPALLDQLVTEFAPVAKARNLDPTAYWISLHYFISEKFSADAMNGVQTVPLRQERWILYATAYWGGFEMRKGYAQPLPAAYLASPTAASVAPLVAGNVALDAALAGTPADKFALIQSLLRLPIIGGMVGGTAYDNFYIMTIGEAPPLGERQPNLQALQPDNDIAYPDQFMRIDYADPIPDWLAAMRETYDEAKSNHPVAFEALLVGSAPGDVAGGPDDLRTLWFNSLATARTNWGGSATALWTQSYFNANAYGTVRWNWGLEATSEAALSALLNNDAATADEALVGNSLFLCAWSAFEYGFQEASTAALPSVVPD
jgi:hypothetical protein